MGGVGEVGWCLTGDGGHLHLLLLLRRREEPLHLLPRSSVMADNPG